jgi:hypothetical protein
VDLEYNLYTPLKMSLLSGLIINFLAVVCLENQCNKHMTLLLILIPMTPTPITLIYITPTVPTTPKIFLSPFTPKLL